MQIKLNYRVDKRIKVIELRTGTKAFLVNLNDFTLITAISDFEESTGVLVVDSQVYTTLWKERTNYAEPNSFRFRQSKG